MQETGINEGAGGESLVALCVGNTRTRVGVVSGGRVSESRSLENTDAGAIEAAARELRERSSAAGYVLSTVNPPFSGKLELALAKGGDVYVIGRDIEIPIRHALDDDSTVGQDRLLDAVGAFAQVKEACVVIDLGTAITIDFVDGEGTFQGGVIAPGLWTMLRSLHSTTAALPELRFEMPDPARGPFGKDTRHAMLLGVRNAVVGLVRQTLETFAEKYNAFAIAVATGGDAGILEGDPFVERFVPDLQMMGVAQACLRAAESPDDEPS